MTGHRPPSETRWHYPSDAARSTSCSPRSRSTTSTIRPLGVREAGRVGDLLVASTYAVDDDHPAKAAVDQALSEVGWTRPPWYAAMKSAMAAWGTIDRATAVIERGGMRPRLVERREITFPDLGPADMVAWRMGLAQSAGFVEALDPETRRTVVERALCLLGPVP